MDGVNVVFRVSPAWRDEDVHAFAALDTSAMTIRKAWGAAPYVGRPFVYVWDVAIDDEIWIAGPAHIEYL